LHAPRPILTGRVNEQRRRKIELNVIRQPARKANLIYAVAQYHAKRPVGFDLGYSGPNICIDGTPAPDSTTHKHGDAPQ
jgi:hypothetical protein